ncbi:uncharacterized protein LOC143613120 [Bidens hawaiensis]|uniref:uncharacterized protein LOC143613120 n=1 Tax=Bidens hawaiensis TaxID=980011 RepID=UPI0040490095
MGSDPEPESDPYPIIPKLPLFSIPHHVVTQPSSMPTPPRQTLASVPFQWEEQPGKPHPCTDIVISSNHTKCLELPPRLAAITKISSPTTVLDGPGGGRSVFSSASFRFNNNNNNKRRRRRQMQGSFDSSCSGGWSPTEDNNNNNIGLLQPELSDNKVVGSGRYRQFGSFRIYKPKVSIVISPSSDSVDADFADENNNNKMRRNSSLSKVTRSDFWAKIYQGFKQVVPWKKKTKKESFTF